MVSKAVCFHLSMSAPCFHVRKMRRSAERRFVRHVTSEESIAAILYCKDIQLMKTESRQGWIIELRIQLQNRQGRCLSCESVISDGFELFFAVHFLYPKFVLPRSKQLMPVTVKFQTEVLVCGLQGHLFPSFEVGPMFPCSKNATQCRKEICSTCYV